MSVDARVEAVSLPALSIAVGEETITVTRDDDTAAFEFDGINLARYQGPGLPPAWAENALRQLGAIVE